MRLPSTHSRTIWNVPGAAGFQQYLAKPVDLDMLLPFIHPLII